MENDKTEKSLVPKAINLLNGLEDLNLIKIKGLQRQTDFTKLLAKQRENSDTAPGLDEIAKEVEAVRNERYGN